MGCMHLIAGILGNATSLLLYAAPILTFRRVIRKRSTEEFSCVPYVVALLNCLLYTWYGLPVVSVEWENFPVVTINGLGILLESSFIIIYFVFAAPRTKMMVILMLAAVLLVFGATACVSSFKFSNHHHRKMFVGSVGLVASVCMYGSPLVVMAPNLVGSPLGLMQLILYCMYKKNDRKNVQGSKLDVEKGAQLQAVNGEGDCNAGDMKYKYPPGVLEK
ncbi:bidirectional sugar transporter SWEET3-like isoform X2 [Nymphaea colorata]|uniref:bidirectional sugar transporter SWEET3-like isoform X2 n=1 Tax=Nymphaea colorata TaxID=210225 RepID=UPI00214F2DA1|nr:bidirectional sugar transporter SWEET3-like isoform X2 [Nymphaea colorata]